MSRGKIHGWNWHDICRPKTEEGMGLRRIRDINEASGIKLVWRLCTSDSLWANWTKTRYLGKTHLFNDTSSLVDSGTWEWLCSMKSLAFPHTVMKLGNGKPASLLLDRWIKGSTDTLIHSLPENLLSTCNVSDIEDRGQWVLKHQALQHV